MLVTIWDEPRAASGVPGLTSLATTCGEAGAAGLTWEGSVGVPEKKGWPTRRGPLVSSKSRNSKWDEGGAEPRSAKGKEDSSNTTWREMMTRFVARSRHR